MTHEPAFITIWQRFADFEFVETTPPLCSYAQAFAAWADVALHIEDGSLVTINQAKVLLVDKYFDFFSCVPKNHRYYFNPKQHICIFQVFVDVYRRIRTRELMLTPPMLFIPPPPAPPLPPPPAPQIAGIFFGDEE